MRISDWSSDVCSSDLERVCSCPIRAVERGDGLRVQLGGSGHGARMRYRPRDAAASSRGPHRIHRTRNRIAVTWPLPCPYRPCRPRSEEHTSELQSLMRISYAVFCLKKKKTKHYNV